MIFRLCHSASEKRRFSLLHNLYVWRGVEWRAPDYESLHIVQYTMWLHDCQAYGQNSNPIYIDKLTVRLMDGQKVALRINQS